MKKFLLWLVFCLMGSSAFFSSQTEAAIEYGAERYEAPFAASTTNAVGRTVDQVLSGELKNPLTSSSSEGTLVQDTVGFFGKVNTWLKEKAGIDFVAILKGIGNLFVIVFSFIVDILKKVL